MRCSCWKSAGWCRDIKPQNIFIKKEGVFKLGDFGTARQMEHTSSLMSKKGTYVYMAPEIYRGQEANQTIDIYSLGLVMYRLLNGNRSPFLPLNTSTISPQQNEEALAQRMKGVSPPAPAYADSRLAAIVLKACAYDPRDRYQTAQEMDAALTAYENGTDNSTTKKPFKAPDVNYGVEAEATVGIFQKSDEKTIADTSTASVVSEAFRQKVNDRQPTRKEKTPSYQTTYKKRNRNRGGKRYGSTFGSACSFVLLRFYTLSAMR